MIIYKKKGSSHLFSVCLCKFEKSKIFYMQGDFKALWAKTRTSNGDNNNTYKNEGNVKAELRDKLKIAQRDKSTNEKSVKVIYIFLLLTGFIVVYFVYENIYFLFWV